MLGAIVLLGARLGAIVLFLFSGVEDGAGVSVEFVGATVGLAWCFFRSNADTERRRRKNSSGRLKMMETIVFRFKLTSRC